MINDASMRCDFLSLWHLVALTHVMYMLNLVIVALRCVRCHYSLFDFIFLLLVSRIVIMLAADFFLRLLFLIYLYTFHFLPLYFCLTNCCWLLLLLLVLLLLIIDFLLLCIFTFFYVLCAVCAVHCCSSNFN